MADKFKLQLSKLDFISLVDHPAQQTATLRLLKRAGTDEMDATATARLVKISTGADPLAYFWAFTCTDDTGAVYHDLQGDAISPEFIKVAEQFMAERAAVDEMHTSKQTSRVAFAFPMDAEIAGAMLGAEVGAATKTSGLMVAIRPTAEALAKLRTGEYNGVSIAGTGMRFAVDKAGKKKKTKAPAAAATGDGMAPAYKRIGKRAVFTSETDGHVHSVDLDDPSCCYYSMLSTSYQTAEGAEDSHSHPWIYDSTTGAITIGADSGHTHTVVDVVPADVLAAAAAKDEPDTAPAPVCAPCAVEDEPSGPTVVVAVNARAPAGNSTHPGADHTVVNKEQGMPTEHEIKIAKQETELSNLRKMLAASLALTEPQRLHVAKLAPIGVEEFLQLDAAGRDAAVKAAELADPEVHKTADGTVIRKSDGPTVLMLAKQADAGAAIIKSQAAELAVAKAAGEQIAFEKRAATDLSHFAKAIGVRAAIVKALDSIPDEAIRKDAIEAVKGANFAMAKLGTPTGADETTGPKPDDPVAKLNALATDLAKSKSISFAKAYDEVLQTAEGGALYNQLSTPTPALRAV